MLPADITRELISRTNYQVIDDPSQADAVLSGRVLNFSNFPTLFDPATGRATSVQVVVNLQFSLTERTSGKTLFSRPNMEVRERYQISTNPQQYFDESGTAIMRLSQDVAAIRGERHSGEFLVPRSGGACFSLPRFGGACFSLPVNRRKSRRPQP